MHISALIAEMHISALMLRCGIPADAAVGTGTAASALALLVAAVLTIGNVAWPFALVGIPAAIAGSYSARRLALHIPAARLRVGIGILAVLSTIGVAIRAVGGV